jgi:hypothetical protein
MKLGNDLSSHISRYCGITVLDPLTARGCFTQQQFTIKNFKFCPKNELVCFVWISEQTVIISLYSITSLGFVTETKLVNVWV